MGCSLHVLPLNSVMRLFAIILSLYIATLSMMPCTDGMLQTSNHSGAELTTVEHNHNHSDHQDDCPPFCVCACCGINLTLPSADDVDMSTPMGHHIVIKSLYSFDYSFDYKEGIWHPPTIS